MFELIVILKADDKTYKEKFLCYEALQLSYDSDQLKDFIDKAKKNFPHTPEKIAIKIAMECL